MKIIILFILTTFCFSNEKLLLLYPDADLSNTAKLNVSDVNAVHLLFKDGFNKYSNYEIISPSDNPICYSSECALSLAKEYNVDQVVTSKIRVLGSKIIFTGMIQNIDGSSEFATRITALNVEDMENASYRLSKSLINRDSIEDVVDIDNIIDQEEEVATRRKSLKRIGLTLAYTIPFGGENYWFYDDNKNRKWNATPLSIGYVQNWELKSNNSILLDAFLNIAVNPKIGIDLTYNTYANKSDNSMFYGYGIGWHFSTDQYLKTETDLFGTEYEEINYTGRHGPAILGQVGYIFMRTYNINIMLRAKYHMQFSTLDGNFDNGITLGVSIINKFQRNNNQNRNRSNNNGNVEYRFPLLELLLKNL
jgi:hypothetical protein